MTAERWQRILRVMDEAFADYLTGMSTLRKRVVGDVKRKLSDGEVLDRPPWNIRYPESDRLRRRGSGVRDPAHLAADVRGPARHLRGGKCSSGHRRRGSVGPRPPPD